MNLRACLGTMLGVGALVAGAQFGLDLTPIGAPRRNWKTTLVGDGYVIVRHPDLQTLFRMAERAAQDVQLFAS